MSTRLSMLALAALAASLVVPAAAGPRAEVDAPLITCSAEWLEVYGSRGSTVIQARVVEAEAAIEAIEEVITAQGGQMTMRNDQSNVYEVRASAGRRLSLMPTLQAFDPHMDRLQENQSPQNLQHQCEQLAANRAVAQRLQSWLNDTASTEEKTLVTNMMQQHLRQITNLDNQIRNIEMQPRYTIQVRLTQIPRPQAQAKE